MKVTGGYVYIPVGDLNRAREWYADVLGLRPFHEDPLFMELRSESGARVMLIANGNGITSHMEYPNGPQAVYGFTVSDIDAVRQELIDKGVQVGKASNYAGTSFGFTDPDGNVIEVWGDYSGS